MLNKFFKAFNEKDNKNDNHSFESDLYKLIYEMIIADHEITNQEINLASELVEYYFQIPNQTYEASIPSPPCPCYSSRHS